MNQMKKYLYLIISISLCWTQWYQLNHDFIARTYYVSYPDNIEEEDSAPLIINMHGYGSSALSQRFYSEMDEYANALGMAVVYPQGIVNSFGYTSWNVGTFWDFSNLDDVGFIDAMINKISRDFNIDEDRIYACGMSNGGYMSYELACELENKIVAFGSVTGNFMLNESSGQLCEFTREIPIIHFHGTADSVVDYYPPSFDDALTVFESANFWSQYNDFELETMEYLNDNVEIYTFSKNESNTLFKHYKVYGGEHDWFKNDWGFHTTIELINFFLEYSLSDFYDEIVLGDINSDSVINIIDVVLLADMILEDIYSEVADLNSDEIISILDLILLIDFILYN
tara:strand:- start:412 stop:1434 length:1023 start_codon:yes stop_codon:yes gene_type:complete